MAKYGPFTRSEGSAINTPNKPEITTDKANASHGAISVLVVSKATA